MNKTPQMIALGDAALDNLCGRLKVEDKTTHGFLLEVSGFTASDDLASNKGQKQGEKGFLLEVSGFAADNDALAK